MRRRELLGSAPLLMVPALARAETRPLRFIPNANLSSIDPIWTTALVAAEHGFLVFDTLYGIDDSGQLRPQMCEGHELSSDMVHWAKELDELTPDNPDVHYVLAAEGLEERVPNTSEVKRHLAPLQKAKAPQVRIDWIKARLADLGGSTMEGSPADFGKLIAEETEKWGKVVRAANIKPD